jgi:hypothetical protein
MTDNPRPLPAWKLKALRYLARLAGLQLRRAQAALAGKRSPE